LESQGKAEKRTAQEEPELTPQRSGPEREKDYIISKTQVLGNSLIGGGKAKKLEEKGMGGLVGPNIWGGRPSGDGSPCGYLKKTRGGKREVGKRKGR